MAPASACHGQQPFYSVNLLSISESGGGGGLEEGTWSLSLTGLMWETWNVETDGCRIYDLGVVMGKGPMMH